MAQLTIEEAARIGVVLDGSMSADSQLQMTSSYSEMLKALQDVVDVVMEEEHSLDFKSEGKEQFNGPIMLGESGDRSEQGLQGIDRSQWNAYF